MKWTRRTTLISGLVLIGLANAVALGGAAYNRSGAPDSTLDLSERELRPPHVWAGRKENSGLELHLRWRVLHSDGSGAGLYRMGVEGGGSPAWLDESKMASLGFAAAPSTAHLDADRGAAYQRQLPREVFVVLELNGPAYRTALERAASAAKELETKNERGVGKKTADELTDRETHHSSRLFAVDAGLDRAALRSKFGDRAQYAIVRGQVRPTWLPQSRGAAGAITGLSAAIVNVPQEMRSVFEGVVPISDFGSVGPSKHFDAELAFGRWLEPWLVSAAAP